MKETRDKKITRGFLATGFSFNGMDFKPITGRSLAMLEMAGSPYFFGGGAMKALIDVLYVSHEDHREVMKVIKDGSFDEVTLDFAEKFTVEDLGELEAIVTANNEDAAAAIVEVREDSKKK